MLALKRIGWVVALSGLILSGCGATKSNYLIKQDLTLENRVATARLEVAVDGEGFISVSEQRNPGERIALANSVTSAYQSTPPPPGATPGTMAAAFLVTTYMAKATADSAMASESNKKAQPLIELMTQEGNQAKVKNSIARQFLALETMRLTTEEGNAEVCCDGRVTVAPQVRFSNDLRLLEVKVDYLIAKNGIREPVYSNSFIYQSDPVPNEAGIAYWTEDDGKPFLLQLDNAFAEIAKLIDYEFMHDIDGEKQQTRVSTIKYSCDDRTFFERGTLLWNTDQRIILRDLRGNIRSFMGEIL